MPPRLVIQRGASGVVFTPVWKHGCMISILKPGKDASLQSSYQPISLLDKIGKLSETIQLSSILREVNGRRLLCDELFGFPPKYSTTHQLARLVERVTTNFDVKRLTGTILLGGDKAFDIVWVDGLLFKVTRLTFT
jgi:hypothetical protein